MVSRTRGLRCLGTRALAGRVEAIIRDHLERGWLVGNRPFLSAIHGNIAAQCREESLKPPEISTVRQRAARHPGLRPVLLAAPFAVPYGPPSQRTQ